VGARVAGSGSGGALRGGAPPDALDAGPGAAAVGTGGRGGTVPGVDGGCLIGGGCTGVGAEGRATDGCCTGVGADGRVADGW
jgi:hypothetical protein